MNREKGRKGEERAAKYLQDLGYTIIKRNFRVKYGEIDIIATREKEIAFVEVKYRYTNIFGGALSSMPPRRQKRLENAANEFISSHMEHSSLDISLKLLAIQNETITDIDIS